MQCPRLISNSAVEIQHIRLYFDKIMCLAANLQEEKSDMGVLADLRITTYTFDRNLHLCAEQRMRQMHGKQSDVDDEERDSV